VELLSYEQMDLPDTLNSSLRKGLQFPCFPFCSGNSPGHRIIWGSGKLVGRGLGSPRTRCTHVKGITEHFKGEHDGKEIIKFAQQ